MKLRNFFNIFPILSKRSTRVFSLCLAFLVGLSASICRADEVVEETSFVSVDDLTEEQFTELASLSVAVRSAAGVSATSGNITNDVAAILAILQNGVFSNGRFITVPYTTGNLPLQNFLFGLGENWTSSSAARSSSFLYEIQRALYGSMGVPSASDAIQPLLYRLTTNLLSSSRLDMSFTNSVLSELQDSNASLDYVLGSLQDIYQESSFQSGNISDIYDLLYSSGYDALLSSILESQNSFTNWIDDFEYGHGSQWAVHLDDMQFGDLLSAIYDSVSIQTNANSGPQETFGDMLDSLSEIASYTKAIHEDDLDYDGGGSRSVRLDFGYWNASDQSRSLASDLLSIQRQIGVDGPNPTNNIHSALLSILSALSAVDSDTVLSASNAVVSANSEGRSQLTNEIHSSEVTISNVSTNEPDFEAHSYGSSNPISELDGLGSAAVSQFTRALPDVPDSTEREIVLFRGNLPLFGGASSQTRSNNSIYLDVSYPLTDFDAVSNGLSNMKGIMEVVWDLVTLALVIWMYKRFYEDITSGNFEKGVTE